MNTKILMGASAVVMGLLGAGASFAPHETLAFAGEPSNGLLPLVVQITGALYIGFAMMNWMAKDSLIGGIYNRPLAIGNFVHFTVAGIALGKAAVVASFNTTVVVFAVLYALFAIAFAMLFFTSPVKRSDNQSVM